MKRYHFERGGLYGNDLVLDPNGRYVPYGEAAAEIAARDAEIARLKSLRTTDHRTIAAFAARLVEQEKEIANLKARLALADELRNRERGMPAISDKAADRIMDWEGRRVEGANPALAAPYVKDKAK